MWDPSIASFNNPPHPSLECLTSSPKVMNNDDEEPGNSGSGIHMAQGEAESVGLMATVF
jgi:hypothetical protein